MRALAAAKPLPARAEGRDIASFVKDAKKQVADQDRFPGGTYAQFSGAAEAQEKAQQELCSIRPSPPWEFCCYS